MDLSNRILSPKKRKKIRFSTLLSISEKSQETPHCLREKKMSTRLKCRFAFGYSPSVRNGIHFTEKDEAVVHPAGHGVAIVPISKDKSRGYIHGSPTSTGVSAIAMSNDKALIAIAENSTKGFIVNVYDMNKSDEPIGNFRGSQDEPEILSLEFTSDKSRILTLSGKKSDKVFMSMWIWKGEEEKKRVVRSKPKVYSDEAILHLSCGTNPEDRAISSLVGGSVVKVFRAVEQDEIFHPIIGTKTPSYVPFALSLSLFLITQFISTSLIHIIYH